MTSLQQFLSWLKERSKKARMEDEEEAEAGQAEVQDDDYGLAPTQRNTSVLRDMSVRASMKLPPIPREAMRMKWAQRNYRESPSLHIYEEIANCDLDPEALMAPMVQTDAETVVNTHIPLHSTDMDMRNLDFAQAKEFGPYLVVPIKDKMNLRGHVVISPPPGAQFLQQHRQSNPDAEGAQRSPRTDGRTEAKTEYKGDFSSSDSGFHSFSSADNLFVCPKCRRQFSGQACPCDLALAESTPPAAQLGSRNSRRDPRRQNCVVTNLQKKFDECLSIVEQQKQAVASGKSNPDIRRRSVHFADDTLLNDNAVSKTDSQGNLSIECDSRQSDNSKLNFKLSPRSISESDSGNSSVYAYSGSDKDALSVRVFSRENLRHLESDSSNDTFSEYDIQSLDSSNRADPDYAYFLDKAKYNLWLKEDVMRVIKESESSEYESTSYTGHSDDTISLTTVTSLSDSSVLSLDDPLQDIVRRHGKHLQQHKAHRHKKSKLHKASDRKRASSTNDVTKPKEHIKGESKDAYKREAERLMRGKCVKCGHAHSKREACRVTKKKGQTSKHSMEYYTLPDFPRCALDLSSQDTKSSAPPESVDKHDKLSCRATNYYPLPAAAPAQAAEGTGSASASAASGSGSAAVAATNSTTNKPQRRDQNRMLSDLMKRNHDRLLVLF